MDNNYFANAVLNDNNKNFKSDLDILNWYRNFYYQEDSDTERGIMARAINGLFMSLKENDIEIEKINTSRYHAPFDR